VGHSWRIVCAPISATIDPAKRLIPRNYQNDPEEEQMLTTVEREARKRTLADAMLLAGLERSLVDAIIDGVEEIEEMAFDDGYDFANEDVPLVPSPKAAMPLQPSETALGSPSIPSPANGAK
jgi:hypothetical protein